MKQPCLVVSCAAGAAAIVRKREVAMRGLRMSQPLPIGRLFLLEEHSESAHGREGRPLLSPCYRVNGRRASTAPRPTHSLSLGGDLISTTLERTTPRNRHQRASLQCKLRHPWSQIVSLSPHLWTTLPKSGSWPALTGLTAQSRNLVLIRLENPRPKF